MKPKTKALFILTTVLSFMFAVATLTAQVKIGDNPGIKDPSSVLELEKTNMGLLIPRVSLSDIFDITTVPNPANSLLVYNTNFGGGDNPVMPGFYYWREDQSRWVRLVGTTSGAYGDVWIDGNNNLLSANSANQSLAGEHNVILGYRAFADDAGVSGNMIAIGEGAAQQDTTSGDARNIAIGYQAAFNNGGYGIIFMGRESGMNNDGNDVIGIGDYAGYQNMGNSVIAFGIRAAYENQDNDINAFGSFAAHSNTQREVNAFGLYCAYNNHGALLNALGSYAAFDNTGENVCAIGNEAAYNNNGNDAVAIGQQALRGNGTIPEGDGNIGIGFQAGMNIGAGANNIAIGYNVQLPDGFASDQINIGNNIVRDANGVIQLKDLIQLTPTTAPASPQAGMIYFDSGDNMLYCYDGTTWQALW